MGDGAAPSTVSITEGAKTLPERVFAGLLLASLIYTWTTGVFIVPVGLWLFLAQGRPHVLIFLAVYYSFRYIFPAKPWKAFQRLYRTGAKYFTTQMVVFDGFDGLPVDSKRLLCFHPHGILTIGWALSSTDPKLDKCDITWLVTEALIALPFISDFLTWNQCDSVSKQSMSEKMSRGKNLAVLPGGFEEATLYKRNAYRVYIVNRTGFIAMALRHGYTLHPTFTFGEEKTYWAFSGLDEWRLALNKRRVPTVFFVGGLGLMPSWNQMLVTVVGQGIEMPKLEKPTDQDVRLHHERYVKGLQALFERYKHQYAHPEARLEVY